MTDEHNVEHVVVGGSIVHFRSNYEDNVIIKCCYDITQKSHLPQFFEVLSSGTTRTLQARVTQLTDVLCYHNHYIQYDVPDTDKGGNHTYRCVATTTGECVQVVLDYSDDHSKLLAYLLACS